VTGPGQIKEAKNLGRIGHAGQDKAQSKDQSGKQCHNDLHGILLADHVTHDKHRSNAGEHE
jgi:hypothetical protein